MANECIPYYEEGEAVTGQVTAAVVGKTFVKISAARTSGPGLSATAEGSNYRVATAVAGDPAIGVAKFDQPTIGGKVGIIRNGIVPVTAGTALTAGLRIQSDAAGKAIALAAGVCLGVCMNDAANGADAEIALQLT
jgi:hypothetical protein